MANDLYDVYKNKLLGSGALALIDWDSADDRRVTLTDHADNTPNLATDVSYDDLNGVEEVANTGADIGTGTITAGVLDVPDWTFTSVSGDQAESMTIYFHNVTPASAMLLVYIDTATGLPITPNGADIDVAVHASGLFTL